jgi:hypothetical protein
LDVLDLGALDVTDAPDLGALDLAELDELDLEVVAPEETGRLETAVAPTPPVAGPVLEI